MRTADAKDIRTLHRNLILRRQVDAPDRLNMHSLSSPKFTHFQRQALLQRNMLLVCSSRLKARFTGTALCSRKPQGMRLEIQHSSHFYLLTSSDGRCCLDPPLHLQVRGPCRGLSKAKQSLHRKPLHSFRSFWTLARPQWTCLHPLRLRVSRLWHLRAPFFQEVYAVYP